MWVLVASYWAEIIPNVAVLAAAKKSERVAESIGFTSLVRLRVSFSPELLLDGMAYDVEEEGNLLADG